MPTLQGCIDCPLRTENIKYSWLCGKSLVDKSGKSVSLRCFFPLAIFFPPDNKKMNCIIINLFWEFFCFWKQPGPLNAVHVEIFALRSDCYLRCSANVHEPVVPESAHAVSRHSLQGNSTRKLTGNRRKGSS